MGTVEEQNDTFRQVSAKWRWLIRDAIGYRFDWLRDAKWWVLHRVHPRYRYHVVKTGLAPGYYDEDTLILHACMAQLERYVRWHGGPEALEKFNEELRGDPDVWAKEMCAAQADRQAEAVAIYRWWTEQRPAEEKRLDDLLMSPTENRAYSDLQDKMNADEQSMLHRLIDIRPSLWT